MRVYEFQKMCKEGRMQCYGWKDTNHSCILIFFLPAYRDHYSMPCMKSHFYLADATVHAEGIEDWKVGRKLTSPDGLLSLQTGLLSSTSFSFWSISTYYVHTISFSFQVLSISISH